MRRNELDEMQLQKRNKIGNQSFMLLSYLLMIDIGLHGLGFRWLEYPTNVWVIMIGCLTYYMVRVIWQSSYVGPHQSNKIITRKTRYLTGAVGAIAGIIAYVLMKTGTVVTGQDNSALLLFVFSLVMLLIVGGVSFISKRQNKDDNNSM